MLCLACFVLCLFVVLQVCVGVDLLCLIGLRVCVVCVFVCVCYCC